MKSEDIKNLIAEILKRMDVKFDEIIVSTQDAGTNQKFVIKSTDSGMLIGTKGENLMALNHLLKRMANKKLPEGSEAVKFFVDVNDYQEKLLEELKTKVKILSERARSFKIDVELDPMSPYERMLVHTFLDGIPDLKTESKGLGRDRRVVIKYVETSSL